MLVPASSSTFLIQFFIDLFHFLENIFMNLNPLQSLLFDLVSVAPFLLPVKRLCGFLLSAFFGLGAYKAPFPTYFPVSFQALDFLSHLPGPQWVLLDGLEPQATKVGDGGGPEPPPPVRGKTRSHCFCLLTVHLGPGAGAPVDQAVQDPRDFG